MLVKILRVILKIGFVIMFMLIVMGNERWTGITNQQAEMINLTYKSYDDVSSRVDTLKSDSNLNTLPFPRKSTE